MEESPFLTTDSRKVKALLENSKSKNILFSEGTYQVEITEPKTNTTYWPFLQLDDSGKVHDSFCTCKEAEKKKQCIHLAAAYLKIFNGKAEPLHVRFRESLWNQLCLIASRRHGYDVDDLKEVAGGYEGTSDKGKKLFSVKGLTAKGKKKLKEIFLERQKETEETSLKFSNLSQEELLLWREGRPSHQLRYELSFWSDLAKWWMLLQEQGSKYKIKFSDGHLPKWIEFSFDLCEAEFYIAEVNWPQIIPALSTVDSPLQVYEFPHQVIKKIVYDEKERAFLLDASPTLEEEHKNAVEVDEWIFVPHKGFFPSRIDPLLKEKIIPEEKIPSVLHKHAKIIQKYLVGTKIHRDSVKPNYLLSFNEKGDLNIRSYLFEPGDLQKPYSVYFGPWVFVQDKGFYLIENMFFPGIEKTVPKNKVSDFINRHRHWLNLFEGFQTHLSSLESHLIYQITPEGALRFDTQLEIPEEFGEIIDFGDWIYLKGKGFYAKMSTRTAFFLKPGLLIPPNEISQFIHNHRDDLEQIKGFFTTTSPLEKVSLKIYLDENNRITLQPTYFFKSSDVEKKAQLYGDFIYIKGEGFTEIPFDMKLPPNYQTTTVISTTNEPYFIAYELENLKPFISSIDPRLNKPEELNLKVEQIKKDTKSKVGGWLLTLKYQTEFGQISPYEVWNGLQKNKLILFSSAGLILLKQPRFNWLKGINTKRWSKGGEQIRLTTLEWIKLNVFDEIVPPKDPKSVSFLNELKNFQASIPLDLDGFKSNLRPYQETGVKWLWFLYCNGLSGMLCDEMGLGKTHQAMGLIAAAKNAAKDKQIKILVVCPTSVIYHWEDLLRRFFPKIRVLVFYGMARTLEVDHDLLLTSYGTLRSEKQNLSKLNFEIAVFDEIQIAKNAHSQTNKSLRKIKANMRLGLTGTPIENRLLELKSLFDIVLPGYLPNETAFKSLFVNPIERYQDEEKRNLLTRLIKPFILRRKKLEVLQELPEKTEEIAYCNLSDEQRKLYRETLMSSRDELLHDLKNESKPVPFIHVFALLTKLKQICDHPTLITKDFDNFQKHHSGKWDLFVELLAEARESGQKVVVFSQYLDMLNLIEAYLKEHKIGFAGIRGSTHDRREQVERFRQDPLCEVFVASLQAAGVGIDLVAASVVIHYDRWWNPAKENQATDRVHRIGQSRGVQVFKLVAKDTIEEHIHRLIEKKKALASVIAYDDQDQIKSLGRDELINLLKLME